MQVACDHRHLANISCNLRETFVPLQTSPAICGRLSYPYKHLLQLAGDYRTPTNISCNLWETFVPLQTSPATCGRLSYPYIPSPATCGRLSYPYKHLLQLAGDLRTPTNHLLQLAGDYRTPTNISCNLRETIVPLRTSPAICGRLSYPYEKVLQHFFSLTICASY